MREWLHYFRIWFLVCGIFSALFIIVIVYDKLETQSSVEPVRVNQVCTETERVFDYGDVLTDAQEQDLRELIAEAELKTHCDIILLTMNESLKEYARSYYPDVPYSQFVMVKADNFYDEYGFGWNKYKESDDGDGVLLLDNWYREDDGHIYTWLSTSGIAEARYSSAMIDRLLDNVYDYIESDPYRAYQAYIETFVRDMQPSGTITTDTEIPVGMILFIPLIAAGIFILVNLSGKEGKKTTTPKTYTNGRNAHFAVREDRFLRKTVSKRRINTDSGSGGGHSSGGGGGHHTSSGGHSHGGGGHSR